MRTRIRVAAALAVTLALLAVPPMVLLRLGRPATGDYTAAYLWLALRSASPPPDLLAAALTVVAWAAWGVFAVLTLADVVALACGRHPRMTPLRLLALTSISTVLASPSSAGAQTPPPTVEQQEETRQQPAAHETSDQRTEERTRTRVFSGFALDSARVQEPMRQNLTPLLDLVSAYTAPDSRIVVTGHTDASGPGDYNRQLSRQRAEAVADLLGEHTPEGVEVAVRAQGENAPRTEDGAPAPPQAQRRVEITYTLAPPAQPDPTEPDAADQSAQPSAEPTPNGADRDPAQPPPAAVLGGVAAASAALGAGAGRWSRRPTPAPARHTADAGPPAHDADPAPTSAQTPATTAHNGHPTEQPGEPAGESAGILDDRQRLRLATTATADPVRLPTRGGLSLHGARAHGLATAAALACLHEGHRLALTRALARTLGLDDDHPGLHRAADLPALFLHADAHLLGRARRAETAAPDGDEPPLVVLAEAPERPDETARLQTLAADPALVVIALGHAESERAVVCERDDVLHVTVGADTYRLDDLHVATRTPEEAAALLAARAPAPPAADEPSTGPTPSDSPETTGGAASPRAAAEPSPEPATGGNEESPTPAPRTDASPAPAPPPAEEPPPRVPDTDAAVPAPPSAEAPAPPRVRLRVFAPHPVVVGPGGDEIATGLRTTARLLLGLLALRRDDGAGTDEIADILDVDPAAAKSHRTAAVSNARSIIRAALNRPDAHAVIHRAGRYHLDADTLTCDLWDLDDALAAARTAHEQERPGHLRTALEAYTGPLLSELDHPLVETERHHRRRAASSACVEAAHLAPDTPTALEWLERARVLDEHNEAIYQELMRAHAGNDRPDEVARIYDLLAETTGRIGEAPSDATSRLLQELASVDPAARKKPVKTRPRRGSRR
ncbi:OmpA family protein [Streptomonospora salina]|uniref:Outer membrane protein OmpA-like peptidoglycan-associated protein/DNA-binding SARP family transcriptional activator n=1 Tax=Streptomonospora salina TaxID=104205 RepID=A0A841EH05_9ACTN|nr:OmpA family protein [Streptomonospora salina]MBB6000108.1 outer membrane protein OmpA-like peptidoglycan-associated protein/DNA-binding SARP family transcriptional activator [Streptomonospora salina]